MCRFTFDQNVEALWELHENRKYWTTDYVSLKVMTSLNDPTLIEINLMDTVAKRKAAKRKTTDDDFFWLPFTENTASYREKTLVPYFTRTCVEAGFNLISKGWDHRHNFVHLVCNRGRHAKSTGESAEEAPTGSVFRTCRPIRGEDDTCKFGFKVFWNETHKRWCIPKEQSGCKDHNGHTHREPHECRMYAKDYGEDAMQLVIDSLQSAIRPSLIASLIDTREGHHINPKQIRHMKKKLRDTTVIRLDVIEELANNGAASDPTYQPTPADRLLSELESNPKYTYTVLYGQYESDELKIYRRSKDGDGNVDTVLEDPDTMSQNDEVDDVKTYAQKVRDRLSITGSSCILLAVAWTTDEAQRKFEMFPEFSCCDVTHGTNSERRPLLIFCGKDGNNNTFSHTWAFLPNQSRWVFDWFFSYACPILHSPSVLRSNRINITDQDAQECGAFINSIVSVFPNSKHRLCAFHKINRNFLEDGVYKANVAQNKLDPSSDVELQMIVKWLYQFVRSYETREECMMAERMIDKYLDEDPVTHNGKLTDSMLELTKSFVRQKFQDHRHRLYHCYFFNMPSFDNSTSSVNESENHSLKYSAAGPKACDSVDQSLERIIRLQEQRSKRKQQKVAIEMNSRPVNKIHRENNLPDLTRHANGLIKEEVEHRDRYNIFLGTPQSPDTVRLYYLRRRREPDHSIQACQERTDSTIAERVAARVEWYVPKFERTRVVRVSIEHGVPVASCSCMTYTRKGYCCRHVYAVLTRKPVYTDAHIRYWNIYEFRYKGADKDLTQRLKAIRDETKLSGIKVQIEDLVNTGVGDKPWSWFEESLNKPFLRSPSYWSGRSIHGDVGVPGNVPMGPVGLVREAHQSQSRIEDDNDMEVDEHDAFVETNDRDCDSPANNIVFDEFKPERAFELTHKLHREICDDIQTKDQLRKFVDLLQDFHKLIIKENAESQNLENTGGVASLPMTQTHQEEPRMKKRWSPPKKRKRNHR